MTSHFKSSLSEYIPNKLTQQLLIFFDIICLAFCASLLDNADFYLHIFYYLKELKGNKNAA
jgi:hypothetical protein